MVVHIFKKGERGDPSNYRPVLVCCPLGKVMERIFFLFDHSYTNDLLYNYQSGFIPGHSTTFQLVDIYHQCVKHWTINKCLYFAIFENI